MTSFTPAEPQHRTEATAEGQAHTRPVEAAEGRALRMVSCAWEKPARTGKRPGIWMEKMVMLEKFEWKFIFWNQ